MKATQVTKLLAVVAMAASPAAADPAPRPLTTQARVVAPRTPVRAPAPAPAAVVPVEVRVLQMVSIELARPRTMASGAPACGNVASRAPRPASCQPREKP